MILRLSPRVLTTATHRFDVEATPGGHFIKVSSLVGNWAGLYRSEVVLVLLATCHGHPPGQVEVEAAVHDRLMTMVSEL